MLSPHIGAIGLVLLFIAPPAQVPAPAGTPPATADPALADVALEPAGGGRLRHRGDGFTAIINPDGSVVFRDHGGTADFNFFGLDLFRRKFREPEPERHEPSWSAIREKAIYPLGRLPIMGGLSGRMGGLADGRRKDRHKSAKRHFMAATAALRMQLGDSAYRERLRLELAELGSHLAEIWRDTGLPLSERKRQLFERWADCEDSPGPPRTERDAMRLAAASTARAKIEAFVRQNAAEGSPQAFTAAELARLNRGRRGDSRFRPYEAAASHEDAFAEFTASTTIAPPTPATPAAETEPAPDLSFGPAPGPTVAVPHVEPERRAMPPPETMRPPDAPTPIGRPVGSRPGLRFCMFSRSCK